MISIKTFSAPIDTADEIIALDKKVNDYLDSTVNKSDLSYQLDNITVTTSRDMTNTLMATIVIILNS